MTPGRDIHSFSEPHRVRVTHCSLNLEVSFTDRKLSGAAVLEFTRFDPEAPLILDTRDLEIHEISTGDERRALDFSLGKRDPILGAPLTIHLPPDAASVCIRYSTAPSASGLQWLTPEQTAGKEHPFLFSQNQSIHARSWIPIQDSPGVRVTYNARIKAPAPLRALMSAEQIESCGGIWKFAMDLPVPAYLIALAVGDVEFCATGARTGVYAEAPTLRAATSEFSDTEKLIEAVEELYGPYLWGRYDLLVLPPSFPFGGMENPCLTFVTPTVLAGDKSLVGLISHELAHSWSGNLVTNATWSDFWLNEGFTTYIENRIQEKVYGREQALMEQVLDRRDLDAELSKLPAGDQILHIDLAGRDPDEGCTRVPYVKGALFLRSMEQAFGRAVFDDFLRAYFRHFAFQSITTGEALNYLETELLNRYQEQGVQIAVRQWIYEPGLPASAPAAVSSRLQEVVNLAGKWERGELEASAIDTSSWRTQEWLEFLQVLQRPVGTDRLLALDAAFRFTRSGNYEVLHEWLLMAIKSGYEPAYPRLERFLLQVGRTRYIRPLYEELMKSPEGRQKAQRIYAAARAGYHPITQTALDKVVRPESHFSR